MSVLCWSYFSKTYPGRNFKVPVSPRPYISPMTTKKPRRALKMLVCPECGRTGTLRKIIYGMPDPETFDFEMYAVGGCCMNGDGSDPDVSCRACDWSGFRDSIEGS